MSGPRPFYWSVRRELWENRALTIAPPLAAGVALTAYLIGLIHPTHVPPLKGTPTPEAEVLRAWAASPGAPFDFAAGVIMLTVLVVAIFYCLGALQGEQRDRTILFWRSLPVSDPVSVLAKAAVPLAVLPLISFAVVMVTRGVMASVGGLALLAGGHNPADLWAAADLPASAVVMLYSVSASALWMAPVWGWLLLVSAWARRMPILWAIGLPLAPAVIELVGFRSTHLLRLLNERLVGSGAAAFDAPTAVRPNFGLAEMDPVRFVSDPSLWVGLALTALFLAAAVWLRRRRETS